MRTRRFSKRGSDRRLWIVLLALTAVLVYFASGRYGLIQYLELSRQRRDLQTDIDRLQRELVELRHQAERLENDPQAKERVARERYRMGKEDEILFLVPEKR